MCKCSGSTNCSEVYYKCVELVKEPVIQEKEPKYKLVERQVSCPPNCPNPLKAFETLRERVRDARLDPLEHKAPCLKGSKLDGLFGSVLKGTYTEYSDVDYAVWMPGNFSVDKHVKPLFDRVFYMLNTNYGIIAHGMVENTFVDVYYLKRDVRFHAFYVDGELSCLLSDKQKGEATELKKVGRKVGAYGEFGGVPGIAVEYATYTSNLRNIGVEEILLWRYLPIKSLMGYAAGNVFGRTYRVNQVIFSDAVRNGYDGKSPKEVYLSKLLGYAKARNLGVEYFITRESLPLHMIYDAVTQAMATVTGRERYKYLGYEMGVFGIVNNEYIVGLTGVLVSVKDEILITAPDRIHMLMPEDCSLSNQIGINFEGGIICTDAPLRVRRLREVVRDMYVNYRSALAQRFDQFVSARIV